MARTVIPIPPQSANIPPIIQATGMPAGRIASCPGVASAGCLTSLNLLMNAAGASGPSNPLIDPNQSMLPLSLFLDPSADVTFQIFSGKTSKTINPEGTNSEQTYSSADFELASLFAQLNKLPITGPVSRDRPLRLGAWTNVNVAAVNTTGTLIGIATDEKGRVPEASLRWHLSKIGAGPPQLIDLCSRGYHPIGNTGLVSTPTAWCDGMFPPGYIVPYHIADTPIGIGATVDIPIGPLQNMVSVALAIDVPGDMTFEIIDPETGKTAQVQGGDEIANPAPTASRGSMLNGVYSAARFTTAQIVSGINPFPWTQIGVMSQERPLILRVTSAAGATFGGFIWAIVLGEEYEVPAASWQYAQMLYGGAAAPMPAGVMAA
jgi:hypothetical protein